MRVAYQNMKYDKSEILNLARNAALHSRKSAVLITAKARTSHIGSCLSVIDILAVLFSIKENQRESKNDQILLSKGHAAAGLYCVLDYFKLLNSPLEEYCLNDSLIYGHVNHHASDQIPLSTGSLGHGLPFGIGLALAKKLRAQESKTFVVISDGELNEGTTWESALFAGHHELRNLTVIIDRNRMQSLGFTEETLKLNPIREKWESFGWSVREIDGHDYKEILNSVLSPSSTPLCIIANTVKGKGVSFMENSLEWHYKSASDSELESAIQEIELGLL